MLLSPSFAASHCLRTRGADAAHRQQVGIAFEPVDHTDATRNGDPFVDVRGVLWVDERTSELRTLEFSYAELPAGVPSDSASGSPAARSTREW